MPDETTQASGPATDACCCAECDAPLERGEACPRCPGAEVRRDPWIGRLLGGRYRLVRRVGVGGYGLVFAARHVENGLDLGHVAVKVLRRAEPDEAARFLEEAATARRVRSPHVLEIFAVGRDDEGSDAEVAYVVMPLLEGCTLHALGTVESARARSLVRQSAKALEAIHAAGLAHRDVKPSNLWIGPDDHVTMLDFGIARGRERLAAGLATRAGTPAYMAPEAHDHLDAASVDERVDLYALGVVWHELVTGARPLHGTVHRAFPRHDAPLLRAMLAPRPGDRPSAREVVKALGARPKRRGPWLIAAMVVVALGVWFWQRKADPAPLPTSEAVRAVDAPSVLRDDSTDRVDVELPAPAPSDPSPPHVRTHRSRRAADVSPTRLRPVLDAPR